MKFFFSKSRNKTLQCYDRWAKFFDQPDKNDLTKNDNALETATGQENYYSSGC